MKYILWAIGRESRENHYAFPFSNVGSYAMVWSWIKICFSVYLDTYINCDKTFQVSRQDEIIVEEEQKVNVRSGAAPQCTITFKAEGLDGRLCVQLSRLAFRNCNMELKLHDTLEVTDEKTTVRYLVFLFTSKPHLFHPLLHNWCIHGDIFSFSVYI